MESFKFKVVSSVALVASIVYEATNISNGTTMVSWVDRDAPFACYYDSTDVAQFIKDGHWRVVQ